MIDATKRVASRIQLPKECISQGSSLFGSRGTSGRVGKAQRSKKGITEWGNKAEEERTERMERAR